MKSAIIVLVLLSAGCASKGHWLDGVNCPDPPPLHPNVIIGSTPCIRK